ncbi:alpha-D-ribose 1-methylphosphonate 5-triphosphate diphosphatase [Rhodobacteraceae bacterium 2CG4]|uniref:Alpha-D-ribose 1-methylphosphonate 5-triphosphate diphosphatase n=1 Tax=Halovulum marinum TaxID=2662447 RepID=A0A6L5YY16_9RHOB|nr:alpha-D-ribose 1-methylphosphonate 5-triphosphate diphosphatase [Halovulum marinum]MSU88574.1 alpha-D-ribose 1-methylphosphonate 5-triphosphate diphosphatase [Halovulum marinum]
MRRNAPETVWTNARLVLPDRVETGALRAAGGTIADLDPGAARMPGAIDCAGDYLCPGLIELHTDNLERHLQPRPGVEWPHAAAIVAHDAELAGVGVTTVFDAVRVGTVLKASGGRDRRYARQMVDEILAARRRGALRISHFLHLRAEICSHTLTEELDEFHLQDRIGILSLMDHTPGARQFRDMDRYRTFMTRRQGLSEDAFERRVAQLRALGARVGAAHQAAAIAAAGRLGAILASHDDTTPEHVRASAGHGVRIAEFPTTAEAARACREHGIAVMMGAPNLVRGGSHSGNVAAAALADAGLLDILSSDYIPGALLAAAVDLGRRAGGIAAGIAAVTAAPAAAAGLDDRGTLRPGLRADLVRFALIGGVPVVRGAWVRGERVA